MSVSFEFLINIIVLLAQLYLGLIVILHNPKSWANRFFLALVFFIAFQGFIQSFNIASLDTNHDLKARLSVFTVPAQLLFLLLFLINFPKSEAVVKTHHLLLLYVMVFGLMFLVATPLVFERFIIEGDLAKPIPGPLFPLFAGSLAILVLGNVTTIFIRYAKIAKEYKKQILIIGIGIAISFLSLLFTQFILPNFFGIATYLNYISLFTLPMLIAMGFAIAGYRIFDVRIIPAEIFTLLIWVLFLITLFFRPTESPAGQVFIFSLIILFGILLTKNITTEVKQRDMLQKLSKELADVNEKLRQFMAFAAHDLKNPVAITKQLATLIYDKTYTDPQKIEETAGKIKMAADRAVRLIEDFLDLRNIEGGQIKYNFEQKNIVEFIKGVASDFVGFAEQKGLTLSVHLPPEPIQINIDTVKMRQVIQNLLDNSLKYTPTGSITIEVKNEGKTALISVTDTGLGMNKELLPVLFEQFQRDPKVGRKIQGTGLGLFITKQFVLGHKGEIWAESDGEGKGSRFFVRLPKS